MKCLHSVRASVLLALVMVVVFPARLRADERQRAPIDAVITFLDRDAAQKAIVDDSADPYFERLTAREMTVKTGSPITGDTPEEQRKECKARYQAACEEFTEDEQKLVSAVVAGLQPALQREMPKFAEQPWSFIKVNATIEGGMPHTRGSHIILPAPAVAALRRFQNLKPPGGPLARLFIHEQVHVVQRVHPEWFTKLYTEVLGFEKAKQIESHPWIKARQIVNPDGPDVSWVMPIKSADGSTRWIWPLILLGSTDATTFEGLQMVGIDLQSDGKGGFKVKLDANGEPEHAPLTDIQAYLDRAHVRQDLYHPNEIAAELLPLLVLQPDGKKDELRKIRAWATETFQQPR